jgi:hypothetical protein
MSSFPVYQSGVEHYGEKYGVYRNYGAIWPALDNLIWVEDAKGNFAPMRVERVEFLWKTLGYP